MTFERDNQLAREWRREHPSDFAVDPRIQLRQTDFGPKGAESRYGSDHRTVEEMKSDLEQASEDWQQERLGATLSPTLSRSLAGDVLPEEVEQE